MASTGSEGMNCSWMSCSNPSLLLLLTRHYYRGSLWENKCVCAVSAYYKENSIICPLQSSKVLHQKKILPGHCIPQFKSSTYCRTETLIKCFYHKSTTVHWHKLSSSFIGSIIKQMLPAGWFLFKLTNLNCKYIS